MSGMSFAATLQRCTGSVDAVPLIDGTNGIIQRLLLCLHRTRISRKVTPPLLCAIWLVLIQPVVDGSPPRLIPALGASRHMYWMASWSPSQSEPLMVSYACHLQSSSVMLPRAALMPPCAATVCERVGKSLVMHAVLRPCSDKPMAARRPAPPAPTTTASYSWSIMV